MLVEAQSARDSLERQLHTLKDESTTTLTSVLQRLQAIDAQAQRSGRQLVEQRQAHAQELARMDDALERHRRSGAQGRLRLVLGSQRARALASAWQTWRLTTLAHAMLLHAPLGELTQDEGTASHPISSGMSASVGQSMSTPSLHTALSATLSTPQTPIASSSRSSAGVLSPLQQAAQARASANGLSSTASLVLNTASTTTPFNAEELIPPQVLQAANSPAPLSRSQKAAQASSQTNVTTTSVTSSVQTLSASSTSVQTFDSVKR